MTTRVLVVGGAGAFGRRLVEGLAASGDFDVVVAGRDLARAQACASAFARTFPESRIDAVRLDANAVSEDALRGLGVGIVADAAGPFQNGSYRLAEAAVDAGLHYVDLADARDFVAGFGRLDAAARGAGVVALTGASSTPALSNAVLDRLTAGWRTVETVAIAISPGNRAPRGLSVVRAILSYAGRPVRLFLDGRWQSRPGWGLLARRSFPGLGRRWLSLCDTPDLDIVPARFAVTRSAVFRAGLELSVLHLGLWLASLPVRLRAPPSLVPLAEPFRALAVLFERFGTDAGGMLVEARGRDAERRHVAAHWTLIAAAGDGPYVPTLPALAAIRQIAAGTVAPGARACVGVLPLDAIEAEMRRHRIRTATETSVARPLFARALGEAFLCLPEAVRAVHDPGEWLELAGEAEVERGRTLGARLIASLFRLPRAGSRVPVRVIIMRRDGHEAWIRDFAGRRFRSTMRPARAGAAGLRESLGPFTFDLAVPADARGLEMRVLGWRIGPMPLPKAWRPTAKAREFVDEWGRFRFDVEMLVPGAGRLVRYRGWLEPVSSGA